MEENWFHDHARTLIVIGIIILATVIIAVVFRKVGDKLIKRLSKHDDFDPTNFRFLQHIITALLVLVGISMIIFMIPGMRHVAKTLLTGAGILAVVVGFASQAA